jgi:NAD(P)H-flavin reductase
VLVGAREPSQLVFAEDLAAWEQRGAVVRTTVDRAGPEWRGRVGLVTTLLNDAGFDPANCRALMCGPEIMMRFTARALEELGVSLESIWVSLERNMQCGLGWCGHCQLGPLLLCRDGPVVRYGDVRALMSERER